MFNLHALTVTIDFDQPENLVFPGEILSGSVVLYASDAIAIQAIRIYFHGSGKASWNGWLKFNTSREVYLSHALQLLQSNFNLFSSLQLQPGRHSYPFSFRLPADLPSSCAGPWGYIRYKAKATVDGQWHQSKYIVERIFFVSRPLDITKEPVQLQRESSVHVELDVSSGCYGNGAVVAEFIINRRCFVPSEKIILHGSIENISGRIIHKTTVAIVQKITLFKSGLKRKFMTRVSSVDGPPVLPCQTKEWSNIELLVPYVPVSRLDGCGIVRLDYLLKLWVVFRLPCSKFSKTLKSIVIGNVPLQLQPQPGVTISTPLNRQSLELEARPHRTSARSWGTQWDMVNWMMPLENCELDKRLQYSINSTMNTNSSAARGSMTETVQRQQQPTSYRFHTQDISQTQNQQDRFSGLLLDDYI